MSEAYREQVGPLQPKPPPAKRGRRWTAEDVFPPKWIEDGYAIRYKHKLPRISMTLEAEKFVNWALSASGRVAVKLDWHRTWLNWCVNARGKSEETPEKAAHHDDILQSRARARSVARGIRPALLDRRDLELGVREGILTEEQARRFGF